MKKLRIALIILAALVVTAGALYGGLFLWARSEPPPLRVQYDLPDGAQTREGMRSSYTFRGGSMDGFCLGPTPEYYEQPGFAYCSIAAPPGTQLRFAAAKPGRRGARLDSRLKTPAVNAELADCSDPKEAFNTYPNPGAELLDYARNANGRGFTLTVPDRPPGYYILHFAVNFQRDWMDRLVYHLTELLAPDHPFNFTYKYAR